MRVFRWIVLSAVMVVPLLLGGTFFLALEEQPRVRRPATFTPENIERARRILAKNDPRTMKAGVLRTIMVDEADVDLAANYLASRYGHGSAQVQLKAGEATVEASIYVPRLGRYVNVEALLAETTTLPRFVHVRVGRLPVPGWLADWGLAWALARIHTAYGIAGDMVRQVRMANTRLAVTYTWQADLPGKLRAVVVSADEQERLRAYYEKLAEVTRALPRKHLSLIELLPPLASLAQERARSADPVAENRAWLLVLTLYLNHRELSTVVPAARSWLRPVPHIVTLNGRTDFTLHFIISAALAAHAGGPLSDAIGLYKEIDDARVGSGFSFNDLAADRAGTRLGELAVGQKDSAVKLQQRLSTGVRERDLMPVTDDLPEFMSEAEFLRRFGGVGAPAYQQMMAQIEQRIAGLALYKGL
ncbi:MAG: hypothetical protein AB7N91_10740 [Candidatus Tectimicrobiota bacterium]